MWTFQRISASFQLTPSRRATKEIFADAVSASISTHALTEGDYPLPAIRSHQHHFNSRPHGGRRGFRHHFAALHSHFNSRPHGGRHPRHLFRDRVTFISTHALTEGDYYLKSAIRRASHFNSRPHGGRRSKLFKLVCADFISTHALTEGDFGVLVLFEVGNIFQLTPSRRATTSFMIYRKKRIHFNSRPHGGRHQNCSSNRLSIHFNSRPHGGRRSMQVLNTATQTFQLTPSRRATMAASIKKIRPGNFNSRPHGGRL